MQFVSDPPCSVKISKMKQRVRWQEPPLTARLIDQTQLVIEDGASNSDEFSFLVIGDSGCGEHFDHHPQRKISEMMLQHLDQTNFVIHTGDIVYQVGSSEYYAKNFIYPYREFLVGGENPQSITYDRLVFNLPFFCVPGNHDYYDLSVAWGLLSQITWPIRHLLQTKFDLDVGWHGSYQGQAYARAFLDYLLDLNLPQALENHLDTYYTAKIGDRRCLRYQPGKFTCLPNRYYRFRYGGIDFFALDSNTFNEPQPLPHTQEGDALRRKLLAQYDELEQKKQQMLAKSVQLNAQNLEQADQLDDFQGQLNQIEETQRDIEKRLKDKKEQVDTEQLDWLRDSLINSWQATEVRGRVLFFHHPPYVTEATKWNQGQTLEVRRRLRQVFDDVAQSIGELGQKRSLVDLVLTGHAHCLEHLYTENTGHADAYINWIVCGGSGHSLRRQRTQGSLLSEDFSENGEKLVGRSRLFVGRNGQGSHKRRPYSFLRIDVHGGTPTKFVIRPYIAERHKHQWHTYSLDAFIVGDR